jgi:3D (Asp-Asp-Asp) domain-containing protein
MIHFLLLALLSAAPPVHRIKVTAYCADNCRVCCGKWASKTPVTATGGNARLPGAAADPRVLPYGSIIDIPGAGVRVIDDTGGAMRQSTRQQIAHVDLRMRTHAEARAWGVRWLDVKILKYGRARR